METLSEAIARLEALGFRDSFQPVDGRLRALGAERDFSPAELVVEAVVRFEGESDPSEQAILFALRSLSGDVRGTFVAGYGVLTDPASAEIVRGLSRAR
jgi:hypothetical protein